ncbi:MAG: diacylglycerol/lipid kinase family protein [Candidatus Nanoarchaeia archaeon]
MAIIAVITNTNSGLNRKGEVNHGNLDRIVRYCGFHYQTKSEREIPLAVDEVVKSGVDILALNSGDGGNHRVITELMRTCNGNIPLVAALNGGTINVVGSALGFNGSLPWYYLEARSPPENILERIVHSYAHLERPDIPFVERKLLKVTTEDNEQYGFMFANGLVTNFLAEYYRDLSYGPRRFFEVLVKSMSSVFGRHVSSEAREYYCKITKRQDLSIEMDGETVRFERLLGLAASSMNLGIDIGPISLQAFRGIEGNQGFQMLGGDVSVLRFVANLPNLFTGRPIREEGFFDRRTNRAVLTSDEPYDYTLDGDMYTTAGQTVIEAHDRLKFLEPPC